MNIKDKIDNELIGHLQFDIVDAKTDEVLDTFSEKQIIVLDAREALISGISDPSTGTTISSIKLGDDVGTGTIDNPQPALNTYDETTMNVIFDAPYTLIRTNPTPISVSYAVTIIGVDVMALYPGDTSKIFTSAALHTGNGNVFSYKRFPKKSISELVNINIQWTLSY